MRVTVQEKPEQAARPVNLAQPSFAANHFGQPSVDMVVLR